MNVIDLQLTRTGERKI